jgi:hypothetical protein
MVDEARLPEHSLLSMRLDTRRSSTAAVWLRCSIRLDAVVSATAPRTLAPDEEEVYARRAVRHLLTSAGPVAHARAAGALAARPLRA